MCNLFSVAYIAYLQKINQMASTNNICSASVGLQRKMLFSCDSFAIHKAWTMGGMRS